MVSPSPKWLSAGCGHTGEEEMMGSESDIFGSLISARDFVREAMSGGIQSIYLSNILCE
jgi:hypothetical protein